MPAENPNKPQLTVKPTEPIVCLEYNPKDLNCLVSGMFSGQVAFWDVRKGSTPVDISILETSHRDPVYNVLWINSKSGTEFFSSSTDGQVSDILFYLLQLYCICVYTVLHSIDEISFYAFASYCFLNMVLSCAMTAEQT